MLLYDELVFQGVTYDRNFCMMNKNFDSYSNSITKIS
jgi:hypothetical protein